MRFFVAIPQALDHLPPRPERLTQMTRSISCSLAPSMARIVSLWLCTGTPLTLRITLFSCSNR